MNIMKQISKMGTENRLFTSVMVEINNRVELKPSHHIHKSSNCVR